MAAIFCTSLNLDGVYNFWIGALRRKRSTLRTLITLACKIHDEVLRLASVLPMWASHENEKCNTRLNQSRRDTGLCQDLSGILCTVFVNIF